MIRLHFRAMRWARAHARHVNYTVKAPPPSVAWGVTLLLAANTVLYIHFAVRIALSRRPSPTDSAALHLPPTRSPRDLGASNVQCSCWVTT